MLVRIKVINEPSHLPRRSIDWELPEKRGDRVSTTIFENALILRYHSPPTQTNHQTKTCAKSALFSATCMTVSAYPLYKSSRQPMGILRMFTAEHFRGVTSDAFIHSSLDLTIINQLACDTRIKR